MIHQPLMHHLRKVVQEWCEWIEFWYWLYSVLLLSTPDLRDDPIVKENAAKPLINLENIRWIAASVQGYSHFKNSVENQDRYIVHQGPANEIIAVVSDGAGSAIYGGEGANQTCSFFVKRISDWLTSQKNLPTRDDLLVWTGDLRDQILSTASDKNLKIRDYAATVVLLVVTQRKVLAFQVGDSSIVGRKNGEWTEIMWPQTGEFALTTWFITENHPPFTVEQFDAEFDAFALFSDGVGDLGLDYANKSVFGGFFEPLIKPVERIKKPGFNDELSNKLHKFLERPDVCKRTEDDKTLILISV